MKRTTVYIEPDTDVLLKLESMRRRRPVAEIIREAIEEHVSKKRSARMPPGIGAFDSGRSDTAERAEEILRESDFGEHEKA
jgi:hypothetical protein